MVFVFASEAFLGWGKTQSLSKAEKELKNQNSIQSIQKTMGAKFHPQKYCSS